MLLPMGRFETRPLQLLQSPLDLCAYRVIVCLRLYVAETPRIAERGARSGEEKANMRMKRSRTQETSRFKRVTGPLSTWKGIEQKCSAGRGRIQGDGSRYRSTTAILSYLGSFAVSFRLFRALRAC